MEKNIVISGLNINIINRSKHYNNGKYYEICCSNGYHSIFKDFKLKEIVEDLKFRFSL